MTNIKNKYLIILIIILFLGLISVLMSWFLNPQIRQARYIKKGWENFDKAIKAKEQNYVNDTYGATTPEETYRLFLEALKKQDIDLASKYFILDKQEEYKKLLNQIKDNNQWEIMMEDLLNPRNSKGKMFGETYVIEVINKDNVSVTTITLEKPTLILGSDKKEINNLWKITKF